MIPDAGRDVRFARLLHSIPMRWDIEGRGPGSNGEGSFCKGRLSLACVKVLRSEKVERTEGVCFYRSSGATVKRGTE